MLSGTVLIGLTTPLYMGCRAYSDAAEVDSPLRLMMLLKKLFIVKRAAQFVVFDNVVINHAIKKSHIFHPLTTSKIYGETKTR